MKKIMIIALGLMVSLSLASASFAANTVKAAPKTAAKVVTPKAEKAGTAAAKVAAPKAVKKAAKVAKAAKTTKAAKATKAAKVKKAAKK